MGIEPTRSAWKAEVLPLNYIRIYIRFRTVDIISKTNLFVNTKMRFTSKNAQNPAK